MVENYVIVNTIEDLKSALKRKESKIIVRGKAAVDIQKHLKRRKVIKQLTVGAIAAGTAAIIAAPFTGGTSLIPGVAALTIGGGTVAISATEIAVLLGGTAAIIAVLKGRKVIVKIDGNGQPEITIE